MVGDQVSATLGIDSGGVADVVPVRLQEPDHRVLRVPDEVFWSLGVGIERPVVAHLVGAAGRAALVQAVAAVVVVRLPGGVGGLEEQVRRAGVVANDKDDVARC